MQTFLGINIWAQLVMLPLSPNTCVKVISSCLSKGNSLQKITHPACLAPFPQTHLAFSVPSRRGSVSFSGLWGALLCAVFWHRLVRQSLCEYCEFCLAFCFVCFFFVYSDISAKRSIPHWGPLWRNNHTVWTRHLTVTSTAPPIPIVVHSVKADKKLLWDVTPSA